MNSLRVGARLSFYFSFLLTIIIEFEVTNVIRVLVIWELGHFVIIIKSPPAIAANLGE